MTGYRKKLKPSTTNFTPCYDHRESGHGKKPWLWMADEFDGLERTTLKTGDYSIVGYEGKVALEHKSGIAELYKDLVVSYRPTFTRFLKRMAMMTVKSIIVEQELTRLNVTKVVTKLRYSSQGRSCLTEETAWYWIGRIQTEFHIPIIFCDSNSVRPLATEWMKHAYRQVR